MKTNLEDFLTEDMWNYFNSDEDAEEEYNNENDDAVNDDLNNENYYGENAGEVLEDGEESDDEDNDKEEKYMLYKNKKLKVRFALINEEGEFVFEDVEPETFDFLILIGLDKKDVFYFDIMIKEEAEKKIGEDAFSQNGNMITLTKTSFNFGNHITIEDIGNYIENHSN